MSRRARDSLSELMADGWYVQIFCMCGHRASLDPKMLLKLSLRRKMRPNLEGVAPFLKCSKCGSTPYRVQAGGEKVIEPNDRERARNRRLLRG